ncbi:MAG: hypothetical protein IJF40_01360 [Clostridia bacterium]|nr:hypothetical protein [Clostridia bacterium]
MKDKINKAWTTFSTSGKVEDYLTFTMLQNQHVSTEENLNADVDRGSDYQNKRYR